MNIVIRKINESKIQIDTNDFDFVILLREKFSFMADNYRFHPAFKNKQWDGRLYLMTANGILPLGLYKRVIEACELHNKTFFIDPAITALKLDEHRLESFVDSLSVCSGGERITPYLYQLEATHYALEQQRAILLSPTSSGKSLVIYLLIQVYLKMYPNERFLIMVPNVGLVTQLHSDFRDYSSDIDWNPDDYITKMSKGKLEEDKQIVLTTYQSMSNSKTKPLNSFFEEFKVIINDEVHTAAAKSLTDIINKSVNANVRIGLTGTLSESKSNEMSLVGLFGEVFNVISTKELMDDSRIANLVIEAQILKYSEQECKFLRSAIRGIDDKGKNVRKKADYVEEIKYITESELRNQYLVDLANSLTGNTIVMIHKIEHGEVLVKMLKDTNRKVYLYNGSVDKETREEIRKSMEIEDGSIIVGSIGTISTGISIKRLNNLILAHPSKSKVKVLQSVGRLLRLSKFDNNVTFYDIVDDYCIGAYKNYVFEHGLARTEYYNQQQFTLNIKHVNMEEL